MSKHSNLRYIPDNNITASTAKRLGFCLIILSVGYQYKLLLCGIMGLNFGFEWICYSMIHGISSNHWIEHIIYVPIMWITLNKLNEIVFGPGENEVISKSLRHKKWIGLFLCAIYIYGQGIHMINTVEIWASKHNNLNSGPVYEQIWWLDEQVSHWVQFFSFFLLIGWFIAHDRLDRTQASLLAIITGIIHGIDRGVGVIEGDNPILAFVLVAPILLACLYRWSRHDFNFKRAWKDFFFRHGCVFAFTVPLSVGCYPFVFGGFVQPSEMVSNAWKVVLYALIIISLEILLVVGLDRMIKKDK